MGIYERVEQSTQKRFWGEREKYLRSNANLLTGISEETPKPNACVCSPSATFLQPITFLFKYSKVYSSTRVTSTSITNFVIRRDWSVVGSVP